MKILVLADQKSKYLYDFYEPDKLKDIDLIISCGDLSPSYLSFFVTLIHLRDGIPKEMVQEHIMQISKK